MNSMEVTVFDIGDILIIDNNIAVAVGDGRAVTQAGHEVEIPESTQLLVKYTTYLKSMEVAIRNAVK